MFIPFVYSFTVRFAGTGSTALKKFSKKQNRYMYRPKRTIECLFCSTGTRHEMVLTKSIPRVRDLEDIIFRPRVIAMYAFLAITFISDIFFLSFTAQRGGLKE